MSTSAKDTCPRCGAIVPSNAPDALCPACLLAAVLEPSGNLAATLVPGDLLHWQTTPSEFPFVFGDYRIGGLLGRGGMGTVYEAEHLTTGRRIALKMLTHELASPELRQRFLREGRLAAGINHPNSLYIFGSEEIEGVPVITMEIASSGTLQDQLTKHGPFAVAKAVDAILDVLAGLEAAWEHGILHRDIKPSNCFVYPDDSVKIGDFGLSVSTLDQTDTFITAHGALMGTPAFAAPEQLRGDVLDVRADLYAVGATLFTLLTNHAPFDGDNAIHVVANAVHQKPKSFSAFRDDVPLRLERIVQRCLAKEPDQRYRDYPTLRQALMPFRSKEPEPASMNLRAAAGWIDYIIAFLLPYATLMLAVGGEKVLIRPLIEQTLHASRYYLSILSIGLIYFVLAEGLWGAGIGKRLKGLRVVRPDGKPPGIGRALMRVGIPVLCMEGIRIPLTMAAIGDFADMATLDIALFTGIAIVSGWLPVVLTLGAHHENGFQTLWDRVSGTQVQITPVGLDYPTVTIPPQPKAMVAQWKTIGPFKITRVLIPDAWLIALDPVLRRQVWLLKRETQDLAPSRRKLARPGRLRWLQNVETPAATWDAFAAPLGVPFTDLASQQKQISWSALRHWLHDLASEFWEATGDHTLPAQLSMDQVWITEYGRALLLDKPWPSAQAPAVDISVDNMEGQQRFLDAIADHVERTSVPLHARPVLHNLKEGSFEKLSFLAGTLRGLLDKPTEVSPLLRAGALFMLPLYAWVLVFVGSYQSNLATSPNLWGAIEWIALASALAVLSMSAFLQLLSIPFRFSASHSVFRLAIVNRQGKRASPTERLVRWALAWLPLLLPMLGAAWLFQQDFVTPAFFAAWVILFLWCGAVMYTVWHPHQGLHDRWAGTWIVRR